MNHPQSVQPNQSQTRTAPAAAASTNTRAPKVRKNKMKKMRGDKPTPDGKTDTTAGPNQSSTQHNAKPQHTQPQQHAPKQPAQPHATSTPQLPQQSQAQQHTNAPAQQSSSASAEEVAALKARLADLEWKMDMMYENSLSLLMRERARELLHGTDKVTPLVPHTFYREAHPGTFATFDAALSANFFLYGGFELFQLSTRNTLSHLPSVSFPLLGVAYDKDGPANNSVDLSSLVLPPQPHQPQHPRQPPIYNSFVMVGTPRKGGWPAWPVLKKTLATYDQWDSFYERMQSLATSDKPQFLSLQNVFLTLAQLELQLLLLTSTTATDTSNKHNNTYNSVAGNSVGNHHHNKSRRGGGGKKQEEEVLPEQPKESTCVATIGAVIIADHSVANYPSDALTVILDSQLGAALSLLSAVNAKGRLVLYTGRRESFLGC